MTGDRHLVSHQDKVPHLTQPRDKGPVPTACTSISNDNVIAELDHLIGTMTSQQARNEFDVVIEYWEEAGLDKPSVVRCSKLNTLHYKELLFKIGKLHESDLERVLTAIRNYFLTVLKL